MADNNFIANHASLGNYVHGKEITPLDYNIGMARIVKDRNDRIISPQVSVIAKNVSKLKKRWVVDNKNFQPPLCRFELVTVYCLRLWSWQNVHLHSGGHSVKRGGGR